jgi:hypothetical protein
MSSSLRRWVRSCSLAGAVLALVLVTLESGLAAALCLTPLAMVCGALWGAILGGLAEGIKATRWGRKLFLMPLWIAVPFGIMSLVLIGGLWYFQPWDLIGPLGYRRLHVGMTETDITDVLGEPAKEYRSSWHVGGITSPGAVTVLDSESGLPFEELPQRYGEKTRHGQNVTLKQWWGSNYAINVAFDNDGLAVGIYLMTFRRVNW